MFDLGLLAHPSGKFIKGLQIGRIGHRTGIIAGHGIIEDINTGQIIRGPVRGLTEIDALVEIFDKSVIKGQARQHGGPQNGDAKHDVKQRPALIDNMIGQPLHRSALAVHHITGFHRQHAQHGGEQGHREEPRKKRAHARQIAKVAIGRRVREIQAE